MPFLVILLHIILISGLAWRFRRRQSAALKKLYWPALGFKLACGVCLGWLYTYYYSVADTFIYFEDASRVASLARQDVTAYLEFLFLNRGADSVELTFQVPRAVFLTRLTSVFCLLTGDNYWVIGFYFSFISFMASWYLVQTIIRNIPGVGLAAATAFLFFPSLIFWTSGLLKEALSIAALFFITASFLKICFREKISLWEAVVVLLSFVILWNLKYYYVAVLVPVIFTTLCYRFLVPGRLEISRSVRAFLWAAIFVLPLTLITFLHPNFNADRILDVIITNHHAYQRFSDHDDVVHFHDLRATPVSMLVNAPWALFSGLFRPLFWEASTLVQFVAGVENTVLLLLFLASLLRFKKIFSSPHQLLVLGLVVYVAMLCVLITFSAPNFGTLSRYRVGYLPFFILITLCDNPSVEYMERSISRLVSH